MNPFQKQTTSKNFFQSSKMITMVVSMDEPYSKRMQTDWSTASR
jgi:hypothetical protein